MLQDFRDNLKGVTKALLIGVIIIPFALFGIDSIFLSGSSVEEAANVNGETISELRLQQAVAIQKQQILSRFQDIDPSIIDDEQLRAPVMQRLIRQKVVEQAAHDTGMAVSKQVIYDELLATPAFQSDGRFDRERYDFVLRQQGYSPTSYNRLLAGDILISQFLQGVTATGFATDHEIEQLAAVSEQSRDFYYLSIPVSPLLESIQVSDEDVQGYYDANSFQFMTEEQLVVEYVELKTADLLSEVHVDEVMVRHQYSYKVDAAAESESRRVAHILLEKQGDGSEQQVVEKIQASLAAGGDFAELAREYSEDYGSSDQGGDLGYTQRGTLPEALDAAIEGMSVGEVSVPVESEAGIHLVRLIDVKSADIASFDDLRESLEEELKLQLAADILPDRIEEMKDLSYNAQSLQNTADQLALELKLSQPFSRSGGQGIATNPLIVSTAFSQEVFEDRYASEVLELADDHVVVLNIREHIAARVKTLDEVRPEIVAELKTQLAATQLAERGEQLKQRITDGESVEDVAKAEQLEWQVSLNTKRSGGNVDQLIRDRVFAMLPPAEASVVDGFHKPNGDYVVVALSHVETGDYSSLSIEQKAALAASIAQTSSTREYQAYEEHLLQTADVASNY